MREGPLGDLVVLELADDVSGAYAGKCLAALGARVIKIEGPEGDPARRVGPFAGGTPHPEKSALFLWLNTSKESVSLDVASEPGRAILDRLVDAADAVIISSSVDRMRSLGFGTSEMIERHPRIVVGAVSPFGLSGPHSGWKADDLVRSAMAGWMHMTGRPEREPLATFSTLPSAVTGLAAASAILMALWEVRRSGRGQVVDVSSQEVLALCTPYIALAYSYSGIERPRSGMPFPMTIVPAANGYLGINVLTQAQWEALCSFTGLDELPEDPDFATPLERAMHSAELTKRFAAWAANKAKEDVFHEGQQWRIPFGYVPEPGQVAAMPPHVERAFFSEIEHPVAGAAGYARMPFLIRDLPPLARAPLLGEHSEAVIGSLAEPAASGGASGGRWTTDDRG